MTDVIIAGLCFTHADGLHVAHSPGYVLLSYLLAAIGSYTALDLVEWLRRCKKRGTWLWHLAAAAAMGGSIWAMHFTGMLGVRIGVPMGFDPWLTLLSLLIAIGMAAISLRIALGGAQSLRRIMSAGIVLGVGVGAMHYTGMAALRLPGTVAYLPGLWSISLLIAVGAAIVALWLALRLRAGWQRALAALLMAGAICGMHYTGMAATVVRIDLLDPMPTGMSPAPMAITVAATTLALLMLALASVAADRRVSDALEHEALVLRRANAELQATQQEIVTRLCAAGEFRDQETGAHVVRMAQVAFRIALAMGCDRGFAEQLLAAAPLHDIGKVGTPDAILFKHGPLTATEMAVMREHATLGARILGGSELPLLRLAAEIAETHHERWDGSGYPNGVAREEIPLAGRIVAVADVFDALLSPRAYKPAWSLERVMAYMQEQAGRHFDPAIVRALSDHVLEILTIWHRYRDSAPTASPVVPRVVRVPAPTPALSAGPVGIQSAHPRPAEKPRDGGDGRGLSPNPILAWRGAWSLPASHPDGGVAAGPQGALP